MIPAILGAAAPALKGVLDLVDELHTSPEEKQAARLRVLELHQTGRLAQIGVNAEEAKHESVFVAGWRPAIGWTCGAALAYGTILQPLLTWVLVAFFPDFPVEKLPTLDLSALMPVLLGMLGLGGLRTFEKVKGANKNR